MTPLLLPVQSIVGGLLIGASVLWNARLLGRVTGISGFLRKALPPHGDVEKQAFIAGVTGASALVRHFGLLPPVALAISPAVSVSYAVARLALGGLAIGFGTAMGNGCTSGHGVCGLGRMSKRSFLAVAVFMSTGSLCANLFNTAEFWSAASPPTLSLPGPTFYLAWLPILSAALAAPFLLERSRHLLRTPLAPTRTALSAASGLLFGTGLVLSRMSDPSAPATFLSGPWSPSFNPALAGVLSSAVPVAFLAFRRCRATPRHKCAHAFGDGACAVPRDADGTAGSVRDGKLVAGAALFGVGWGVTGLCPGPALAAVSGAGEAGWAAGVVLGSFVVGSGLWSAVSRVGGVEMSCDSRRSNQGTSALNSAST